MANLLTQKDKKTLDRRDVLTVVLVYLLGFLFTLGVGLVFLAPSHFLSKYKLEGVENRLDLLKASVSAKKNEETSQALNETKNILSLLKEEEKSNLHEIVVNTISRSPQGVRITELSFKKKAESIDVSLEGVAPTRKTLLAFVDYLKKQEGYGGVNLPIGVLASDANVEFDLSFSISKEKDQQ